MKQVTSRRSNPMAAWQRRALYGCLAVMAGSGLLWVLVHHLAWPAAAQAPVDGLPSPWEPWLMKAHGLGVFILLFLAGRVSATHAMRGWRLRRHRRSGLSVALLLGSLALTGYGLYYLVPESARDALGLVHAGLGLSGVLVLLGHRRHRGAGARALS